MTGTPSALAINAPLTPQGINGLINVPPSSNDLVRNFRWMFRLSYKDLNDCPGINIDKYCSPVAKLTPMLEQTVAATRRPFERMPFMTPSNSAENR